MENKFDLYREAKKHQGGRVDQIPQWPGWVVVGIVLILSAISWWFAFQGYRNYFTSQSKQESSRNMVYGKQNRSNQWDDVDGPIRPGILIQERKPDEMAVVFLDVGQGDAVFIRTPMKENILIDAGEGSNPDFKFARQVDAAAELILPFFKRNKINQLDYFITTHPHSDHIGGAYEIIEKMSIDKVWIAGMDHPSRSKKDLLTAVKNKKDQTSIELEKPEKAGGTLNVGQSLQLESPVRSWLLRTRPYAENVNQSSLVTLLHYGKTSFLFTGDTEKKGEFNLVQKWGNELDVDVLKVGHHGSHSSSIKPFIQTVKPRHSVIMVGHYNSFGHPTDEVLSRLKRVGSSINRTDQDGTIYMFTDGKSIRILNQQTVSAVNE